MSSKMFHVSLLCCANVIMHSLFETLSVTHGIHNDQDHDHIRHSHGHANANDFRIRFNNGSLVEPGAAVFRVEQPDALSRRLDENVKVTVAANQRLVADVMPLADVTLRARVAVCNQANSVPVCVSVCELYHKDRTASAKVF